MKLKMIAEKISHLLAQPSRVDHQLAEPALCQGLHRPLHQRLTANLKQGFGGVVGQRAHAFATASRQDQGFATHALTFMSFNTDVILLSFSSCCI